MQPCAEQPCTMQPWCQPSPQALRKPTEEKPQTLSREEEKPEQHATYRVASPVSLDSEVRLPMKLVYSKSLPTDHSKRHSH